MSLEQNDQGSVEGLRMKLSRCGILVGVAHLI